MAVSDLISKAQAIVQLQPSEEINNDAVWELIEGFRRVMNQLSGDDFECLPTEAQQFAQSEYRDPLAEKAVSLLSDRMAQSLEGSLRMDFCYALAAANEILRCRTDLTQLLS